MASIKVLHPQAVREILAIIYFCLKKNRILKERLCQKNRRLNDEVLIRESFLAGKIHYPRILNQAKKVDSTINTKAAELLKKNISRR
mmetsp:Transcript_32668/g.41768  ORF Transcript_32668/g.41768 Transcript_32668/m.41768 type:complete len:87 (+) Transcript_32668:827-1087(+)